MHSLYNHVCDRETRTYVPVLAIYPRPTPGTLMGCRTFLRSIPAGEAHGHVRCNTLLPQVKNIVTEKDTKETMGPGIENYVCVCAYIYIYIYIWTIGGPCFACPLLEIHFVHTICSLAPACSLTRPSSCRHLLRKLRFWPYHLSLSRFLTRRKLVLFPPCSALLGTFEPIQVMKTT